MELHQTGINSNLTMFDISPPSRILDLHRACPAMRNGFALRRQLREQGVSFRGLLDELRMHLAIKYLRTTKLANEDIALALGFSDSANFRRAFRRWTNKSPSEFRPE
jgi:AraC-like DNA-binding protein